MSSKAKRTEPFSPFSSIVFAFRCPVASRVASKLAAAPPEKLARNSTASSTSLFPFFRPPFPPSARPPGPSSAGIARSAMNVRATAPWISTTSSPVRNRARSTMCAFRSPWAPDPARFFRNRHRSGVSGPPQLWR
jgi:hypothetical protein